MAATQASSSDLTILITGANAGLGFAIARRLISEFLSTRPKSSTLTLILTTRSTTKANDTVARLRQYLRKTYPDLQSTSQHDRIILTTETLELTNLHTVVAASDRLKHRFNKIDAVILNAGIGGWTSINWLKFAKQFLTDPIGSMTWPTHKVSIAGTLTGPQVSDQTLENAHPSSHPAYRSITHTRLGEVFCANVFGHYMLVHGLMPLLRQAHNSRIIWLSSLEAYDDTFTPSDLQCLGTPLAYEASKRLTDLLALTSRLPSTRPWSVNFLSDRASHANDTETDIKTESESPRMYLSHPGICQTGIFPIPPLLSFWPLALLFTYSWLGSLYICRLLGSIWHTCDAYIGATSAVWLALASEETMQHMEKAGMSKWGSAADEWGYERVERTEVEGCGCPGGQLDGSTRKRGRNPRYKTPSGEDRVAFEEKGRECWKGMEELRLAWEELLKVDADADADAGGR